MTHKIGLDTVTPCMTTDPELFFPEPVRGKSPEYEEFVDNCVKALVLCNGCHIRQNCLEYSLEVMETVQYGIYGGTLPRERIDAVGFSQRWKTPLWMKRVRARTQALGIETPIIPVPKEKPKPCIPMGEKFKMFNARPLEEELSPMEW